MQKRTSSNNKTVLVYIGGIGFMLEVNPSLKHNLISPDILAFFDGVPESGIVRSLMQLTKQIFANLSFKILDMIGGLL